MTLAQSSKAAAHFEGLQVHDACAVVLTQVGHESRRAPILVTCRWSLIMQRSVLDHSRPAHVPVLKDTYLRYSLTHAEVKWPPSTP